MRFLKLLLALFVTIGVAHCAVSDRLGDDENVSSMASALCSAEWSATWKQGSGANEWWVEYEIGGGTVASAYLEIPGVRNVALKPHYGKWAASAGSRIATGTNVVLHATTTSGQDAQTVVFRYLVDTAPASDPCTASGDGGAPDAGSDSALDTGTGGGSGGTCFTATFTQHDGANEWWVEYGIGGATIASAYLQVVGGQRVTLSFGSGEWRGAPSTRIPRGTAVFLHAETATGLISESQTFGYLDTPYPQPKPCRTEPSCDFRPTWEQASANEWWVEYTLSTNARGASLELTPFQGVGLSHAWNKWRGKPGSRIPTGTSVTLLAEGPSGEIARTAPFRYLVDRKPITESCAPPQERYCDGYKLQIEDAVNARNMLQRGRLAVSGTSSSCANPPAAPAVVDGTTEFHRNVYRYRNRKNTSSCIAVYITQYNGRAAGTGMRSAAYRAPFDPNDVRKNVLGYGGSADVPEHQYSFTIGAWEEFDVVVTGAAWGSTAAQSGAAYTLGVGGCGRMEVASISPTSGPAAGGTRVTIKGIGFASGGNQTVTIGSAAADVTLIDDTTLTAVTKATAAGTYDVTVTVQENSMQTSTLPKAFTYVEP